MGAADAAQVGDGKAAAGHLGGAQLAGAGARRNLAQGGGDFDDVLAVGVADHRHQETAVGVDGDADGAVALVDHRGARQVDAGVELRKHLQGGGQHLDQDGGHGELAAGRLGARRVALAQLLQLGDVRLVELGDRRDGLPGRGQMGRGGAAHGVHRLFLDRSPLRKIGQWRGRRVRGRGGGRLQQPLGGRLDVVEQDAAAFAGAADDADVDADLARQAAHRGGGRNRLHGYRRGRRRSGGWRGAGRAGRRRRFGLGARWRSRSGSRGRGGGDAGGGGQQAARRLRGRVRRLGIRLRLFGGRPRWRGWCRFRLPRGSYAGAVRLQAGDGVADADGVARLDHDGGDHAGIGRRHLHHRLVGLQFQQRRVLVHVVARAHQDGRNVTCFDILSQFRELYVSCHRSSAR